MYIFETKIFHCNNCNKEISSGEEVWTKMEISAKSNCSSTEIN
ncbi:hypothetical protein N8B79_03290 [Enterococcus faecium]|nr:MULTISPECIES: hypothetical protein [Enterococcus]EFF27053.1 hypothetical protein EfmE1679_0811 [Enterococcus faecium E1679]EFF34305.1 hypothetical protein EfmE1162_1922 [Enterococcus faecium E1162]MCX4169230.1 hypothetical protein [Enterococcus casseliflavus]MEB4735844.1 hypothetical protein [Enterococcus sp. E5-100]MEB4741224.1 hypothetical protein [Enterococcus sp. E4-112]